MLNQELHMGLLSQGKISDLNRVTARIIIKPLSEGQGGKYTKTRYFTSIVRRLAVAEQYSQLFRINVLERKNINLKVRNSLLGIRRGDDFSAHNIFENYHHRSLVQKNSRISPEAGRGKQKQLSPFAKTHGAGLWTEPSTGK